MLINNNIRFVFFFGKYILVYGLRQTQHIESIHEQISKFLKKILKRVVEKIILLLLNTHVLIDILKLSLQEVNKAVQLGSMSK